MAVGPQGGEFAHAERPGHDRGGGVGGIGYGWLKACGEAGAVGRRQF